MQRHVLELFIMWINYSCVITAVTWMLEPGILIIGKNTTLTCTINNVDTIDLAVTRQWSKGAELIAYNGHLDKPSKYSEILTTKNEFSLLIKNLTVSDVTSIYQCQYSFETCTKGLDINAENFEYPPSDKTTHVMYNYTTEGNHFIQLHFTKVFPLPNCTVKIQSKQFNFQVNSVNNHTLYLEVKLIYTLKSEIVCDLQPKIVCHLIGDYPVHIAKFKPCKDFVEKNINLVVFLVPLFSICLLLIALVVCVVVCKRRRKKKTPIYKEVNQNSKSDRKMNIC